MNETYRSGPDGFTLPELVVVLLVMSLLAAVLVPAVLGRVSESRASSLASSVAGIRGAVLAYRGDVRRYPTHLRYLSAAPATARDVCGQSVPAAFLEAWRGPYVDRPIVPTGLRIADATVLDSIVFSPTLFTSTTNGELIIRVEDVDSAVARHVESTQDVAADFASGTIRWTDVLGGRGTLQLVVPIRGC